MKLKKAGAIALAFFLSVNLSGCLNFTTINDVQPSSQNGGNVSTSDSTPKGAAPSTSLHEGETSFIGTITGYGDKSASYVSPTQITVDGAYLTLDLIDSPRTACIDPVENDEAKALEAKESLLPIGTRVLVIRTDPAETLERMFFDETELAVIHLLAAGSNTPAIAPPQASANEQLVRTGYWVPAYYSFNTDDAKYDHKLDYALGDKESPTAKQAEYIPFILAAANEQRVAKAGAFGTCVAQAYAKAKADFELRKEYEADLRKAEIEWKKKSSGSSGGGGCWVNGYWRSGHWVNGYYRNC